MGKTECIPITKSSEEKQCSEFGRSESNYERFHGSSEDDSDEEYFHKSPALALSLYDCVLYKYFDAMFFRAGHVTCSDHTTLAISSTALKVQFYSDTQPGGENRLAEILGS